MLYHLPSAHCWNVSLFCSQLVNFLNSSASLHTLIGRDFFAVHVFNDLSFERTIMWRQYGITSAMTLSAIAIRSNGGTEPSWDMDSCFSQRNGSSSARSALESSRSRIASLGSTKLPLLSIATSTIRQGCDLLHSCTICSTCKQHGE